MNVFLVRVRGRGGGGGGGWVEGGGVTLILATLFLTHLKLYSSFCFFIQNSGVLLVFLSTYKILPLVKILGNSARRCLVGKVYTKL